MRYYFNLFMRYFKLLIVAIILIFASSCHKNHKVVDTKVLCHRGAGVGYNYVNDDTIYENTLSAVKYGFTHFDGVEVDVQRSKSGTLWVFHNSDLFIVDSLSPVCVPASNDVQIRNLNSKLPNYKRLCTLEEVLKYRISLKSQKYISLDVKGYFEESCIPGRNASKEYQVSTAEEIVRLVEIYNLQDYVLVETDYLDVLRTVKKLNSNISCYLLGYNSFEERLDKAKEINVDGLSFNFGDSSLTQESVERLHQANMQIQVWTITSEEELIRAKNLKVDFIQTDY